MSALEQAVIGLVAGVVFGLYGYMTKAPEGEPFDIRKISRTIAVYGAAGLLVGYTGDPITQGNVETATAVTVVLGEVADKGVSKLQNSYGT